VRLAAGPHRCPARTALLAAGTALALGWGVAGCGHLGASLRQREIVVRFSPGATPEQHRAVRAACDHFAGTTAEPLPTSTLASVRLSDVRFRVDDATDAQLAKLEACLSKFPFVAGIDDTSDEMH
jgi:hypothetical protein